MANVSQLVAARNARRHSREKKPADMLERNAGMIAEECKELLIQSVSFCKAFHTVSGQEVPGP